MKLSRRLATASIAPLCLFFSSQVSADGNAEQGADVFEGVCTMCHGEQAQGGEDFEAPKLSGQYDWYLKTQLDNFRKGIRGTHEDDDNGHVMRPMAMGLSDRDVDDVIAYIMTLDANYVEED
jgi:cytochrome c oxidase subunit 2